MKRLFALALTLSMCPPLLAQTHGEHQHSFQSFPDLTAVSRFADDAGYRVADYRFRGQKLTASQAAPVVLQAYGWRGAKPDQKLKLAKAWLDEVEHRHGLEQPPPSWTASGLHDFHAPRWEEHSDGSVDWVYWSEWSNAMAEQRGLQQARITFDATGKESFKQLQSATIHG